MAEAPGDLIRIIADRSANVLLEAVSQLSKEVAPRFGDFCPGGKWVAIVGQVLVIEAIKQIVRHNANRPFSPQQPELHVQQAGGFRRRAR